jgi:NAD(P)-dependent dehydrogenase (short-subunit alcohol dehydrogenase family)
MNEKYTKIAIVSGGATLIGLACAQALTEAGYRVAIADVNDGDGVKMAADLGDCAMFVKTDITRDDDIDACLDAVVERWGGVDALVNVACTYLDNGIASTRDEWLTALNVNVVGGAIFAQKVAPLMQQRGGGAVVNFGSISGKVAQPGRMLYATSKAAILGMTRNQALHLASTGIRVNSVSPGWTWSNVIRDFSGDDRAKADRVAAPFHLNSRLVDAEEVGRTVACLCSDAASGINGTDIAVDGGYTAIGPEQQVDQVSVLGE